MELLAELPPEYVGARMAWAAPPSCPKGTLIFVTPGEVPLLVESDGAMWCPLVAREVLDTSKKRG